MSANAPIGVIGRARRSLDAVRVWHRMHTEGRTVPTDEERGTLSGWSGWGPLAPVFAPDSQTWLDIATELAEMIPAPDLEVGRRSTYSAFYTPDRVAAAMWDIVTGLGVTEGTVLEAGCGRGVFMDSAPAGMAMTGVERDPVSAGIAQLLHPDATIVNSPFESAKLPGRYTAAIGNVPFGDVSVHDVLAPRSVTTNLHNYFLWRIVQELVPGGIAVVLTSRYTMDATNDSPRAAISAEADFLGAIRLPNGGLEGGTEALADIVVLRRKTTPAVGESLTDDWFDTRLVTAGVSVSRYWDTNPAMVLGTMREGATQRYGLSVQVDPDGRDLADAIGQAGAVLIGRASDRRALAAPPARIRTLTAEDIPAYGAVAEHGWEEGSFHHLDGQVVQVVKGHAKLVRRPDPELLALMGLRDLAVELVRQEADHDRPDTDIEPVRVATREAYQAYLDTFGPINRSKVVADGPEKPDKPQTATATTALGLTDELDDLAELLGEIGGEALSVLPTDEFGLITDEQVGFRLVVPRLGGFRTDPDFQLVAALEDYDDETQEHQPAPILTARQNRRLHRPNHTDDPSQALAWSLDRLGGKADVQYIADVLGVEVDTVPGLLGDALYLDPATRAWVLAEEYLSGNVRVKLTTARQAAAGDDRFSRNVTALEQAQPKWLEPHEIAAQLGAPWIGMGYVEEFIREILRTPATVRWLPESNAWEVEGGLRKSAEATFTWGTADKDGYELIESALNNKVPVVRTLVTDDEGREVMRKHTERSMLAVQKMTEIKAKFAEWIWDDPARAELLCHRYNHKFNATAARHFDGSHITVDGLAPWFKPYDHQHSQVARSISTPATLCGHPVGAGKTPTMALTAMKLKQLGLINKPMLAVPKHLLDQTVRKMRQLFPAARILAMNPESIAKNRRAFAARCATGDWDMVIVTHPTFNSLKVHASTEAIYLQHQQVSLDSSIRAACPDGKLTKGMVKAAAKKADRLRSEMKGLRHRVVARDSGVTFEQLGVDYICLDEAHYYKNLALPCRTEGFTIKPSIRATDLDLKLDYLARTYPGRPVTTLYTGTPVSNTMLELYVMLHYLMRNRLNQLGIGSADAWASTFVEFSTTVEVTVTGGGFQMRTMPRLFRNAPELRMLLSQVADIRTKEQLGLPTREVDERVIVIQPTQAQQEYSNDLVTRAEKARAGGRRKAKGADNMLKICTDGRQMATDPVLVGLDDPEPSKLHYTADEMIKIWREHPTELIIGFLDVGTPNAKAGDQSYGRLRDLLVERGMPRNKIRFIHDAKTDAEKAALFAECRRDGGVSVILGSTATLGTGTNIQDRAKAGVDIDAPMVPAYLEQRWGRVDRQGNRNDQVVRVRMVTERTFDAYLWQMLVRKAGFIQQILTGNLDRSIEDIQSDTVLSMSAIRAAATGQPLLEEKANLETQVKVLLNDRRGHAMGVERMRRRSAELAGAIRKAEHELAVWTAIQEDYTGEFPEDAADRLKELTANVWRSTRVLLGGLRVSAGIWYDLENTRQPKLIVSAGGGEEIRRMRTFHTGEQLLKELVKVGLSAPRQISGLQGTLDQFRAEKAAADEATGHKFKRDDELTAVRARLDQIEAELTEAAMASSPDQPATDADRAAAAAAAPEQRPAPEHSDFSIDDLADAVQQELLELELEVANAVFSELM